MYRSTIQKSRLLFDTAVRHAEVSFSGHFNEQASFNDTGQEFEFRIYFTPVIQAMRKMPIQNEISIIRDNRSLQERKEKKNSLFFSLSRFLECNQMLDMFFHRFCNSHTNFSAASVILLDLILYRSICHWNNFYRNSFLVLVTQMLRIFPTTFVYEK